MFGPYLIQLKVKFQWFFIKINKMCARKIDKDYKFHKRYD